MLIQDVAPDRFQLTEYFRRYYKNIELRDEVAIFTDLQIYRMADSCSFQSVAGVLSDAFDIAT